MSGKISPTTNLKYGVEMVCRIWKYPRSTFYHSISARLSGLANKKRGKSSSITDIELVGAINQDISNSHFQGEGHRKIHARLRRAKGMNVSRNRILRLMREHKLLSPHRTDKKAANSHDGRIITDKPNEMWATDAAKIFTLEDGWVWFFGIIEHWNAECLGWHLAKKGNRFAAIEAMTQALEKIYGATGAEVARGLKLRTDHGAQFISEGFVNQVRHWGVGISKGFVREPETNGVIERFHRTLKEQIVHGKQYHSIADLRQAVGEFILKYNAHWLLEKLGYSSPLEARQLYMDGEIERENKEILLELAER